MAVMNLPLSGDVSQIINPLSVLAKSMTGQFGFMNVNVGDSGNPELEKEILDRVGSYGRQLGWIGEALLAMIENPDPAKLRNNEAIRTFKQNMDKIKHIKEQH